MIVSYKCEFDVREYTEDEDFPISEADVEKARKAVEAAGYAWYRTGDVVSIEGERYVDEYGTSTRDVESEIKWLLWDSAEIDADADADEVEYEPDYDAMPGGYDYIWN